MPVNPPANVLVVDDDPGTCETLGDVLRLRGHAVGTATRGREGLDKLAAHPFDAAIVDIRLPDISGLDLLPAIKATSPETEVILITGHASLPTALRALHGAACAYLVKPFEMDHLLAALDTALEKQRLARALRESEERYRLITETTRDAVFLLDREDRLILWNRRAEEFTGYDAAELRGRPILSLLGPKDAWPAQLSIHASRVGLAAAPFFEIQTVRKDGRGVWVEASFADIVNHGQATGRLMVWRDITDRRRAEEARLEAEALRAVAELARATSHEINNPLTGLLLSLELLRTRQAPESKRQEWMEAARELGFRIRDIVGRLAHITRREIDARLSELPMLDIRRSSEPAPEPAREAIPPPPTGQDPSVA